MTVFAQFRVVFNANLNKRLRGGWVQTSIDGGLDVPFKPAYVCNYYGYKKAEPKKSNGEIKMIEMYDDVPRKVNSPDVVLIHKMLTFCFIRIDWNYVTKQGALKNREIEDYWKEEDRKAEEEFKKHIES